MIDLVTDLVGKMVECYQTDWPHEPQMRLRGAVRAAYVTDRGPTLLIEGDTEWGGAAAEPRGVKGEIVAFNIFDGSVRVVAQCLRCLHWAHPSELELQPTLNAGVSQLVHRRGAKNSCRS